jgi:NTP pyrophosphatase (non-canonical NTP hydrolase)
VNLTTDQPVREKTFSEYETIIQKTALYPQVGSGSQVALSYTALGLTGESGEFAEKIKKWIRDGALNKELALKELGDVLWYVTASAQELGYRLQDVAEVNMVKLLKRLEEGKLQGSGDTR